MDSMQLSICRACRRQLFSQRSTRSFSTTSRLAIIPPESPQFVDVPQTFQPDYKPPNKVKGILPVPRQIFPRTKPEKRTPQFITNTIKDPKTPKDLSKLTPAQLHKARTTELRKAHLRASLDELQRRQNAHDEQMKKKYTPNRIRARELPVQPVREDDRLTSASIPTALLQNTISISPDDTVDSALHMHAIKTENLIHHQNLKSAAQKDSLHNLYISARHFILDSEGLDEAIKREFDDNDFGDPHSRERAKSYWDGVGAPDAIDTMIKRSYGSPRERLDEQGDAYRRDQERMKRIGEKLSGGKIG